MTAVDLSANGGFAQLARAFVDIQAQEFLPLLPAAGVRDLRGVLADTGALLLAGVPVLLRLVAWRPAPARPGRDLLPRPAVSQLAQSPGGPGGAPAEEERQERPARGDILCAAMAGGPARGQPCRRPCRRTRSSLWRTWTAQSWLGLRRALFAPGSGHGWILRRPGPGSAPPSWRRSRSTGTQPPGAWPCKCASVGRSRRSRRRS